MSVKFNDIMKKFYEDEMLGIQQEDAPANSSGPAVAGTGTDSDTVIVKKPDARKKEMKKYLKAYLERRAKRLEAKKRDEMRLSLIHI